ncbi:MAG: 3-deoxy-7-phosphoheptulonate synthase [Cycloclasticus pugetii]|jgi:3-deoxy-7-phosphoheptulonate synthase|uniref:Phospho-2-dehydro-3-deoxyheptonate aldolase n=1 Tax=Cycloclasticus zancles 78-ME TaxID=1198232 RepID=S5TTU3_9GAMM|nr:MULTISPECIES: 3-deoxy-7-phosphoheptulonate synthase [Cycloclasticus]AGS38425.1 3-deoxy-D-arabino-heptolosonate-7-phosphate synthetase [Cycloclasticus zancles 78-ME]MBV1899924.1 3-deoxy-7-phosphoheptulonate synthase [Cycloclasticus sp.]MDF1830380.1 3-deoxy-7-phosphoheptulonate synthase [Cycloclasticus pugetii]PHR50270.1 MAG: 3-deoxy-7-phosphoheptulonate synthase [Cycloclasticus sp.]SHJ22559.1 3-deoxy-D-arabinoheptulosonate-7-phosphate synthase [Cycloclasticus pugetii]|tara:strand:- start:3729 stop:4808 length:1080 start_codon:yes stop_codon:yes gene_type:complete
MNSIQTDDTRILGMQEIISPEQLHKDLPITDTAAETTASTRKAIHKVLHGEDDRLLVVIGPCSIHDTTAALGYAAHLKPYINSLSDDLIIVMRVYFEKPRTTVGWKGLINDPNLDNSFDINKGVHLARELLLNLNSQGIAAATEYLDLITPQYVSDLIAWGAIGARTTESQTHRELSSGLSCPVGFKNGTDGTVKVAIDAIGAAIRPHHFLSVTKKGQSAIFQTAGNDDCHLILRGGKTPNYDADSVDAAAKELAKAGVNLHMMIDFSHANSNKQHERQMLVGKDVAKQIAGGDMRISGVMIESHLVAGRQDQVDGQELVYGQSITDACIDWDSSVQLLEELAAAVRSRRKSKLDSAND